MLGVVLSAVALTALAVLFKRLVVRKPPSRPYRIADTKWPSRSYREPY